MIGKVEVIFWKKFPARKFWQYLSRALRVDPIISNIPLPRIHANEMKIFNGELFIIAKNENLYVQQLRNG